MGPFWPPGLQGLQSSISSYELNIDNAWKMLRPLRCKGTTVGSITRWTPAKSSLIARDSHGLYKPKANSCPYLPQREVPLDTAGQLAPTPGGSLLPLLSLPQKGQSSSYPPVSSFHVSLPPQALSSSRSYSAVCIRSTGALCSKRWLGWVPHTPWKHLHLNLKGWVSDSKTSCFFWQGFGRSLVVIKPITFLAHCQKFHLHAWWQLVLCRC